MLSPALTPSTIAPFPLKSPAPNTTNDGITDSAVLHSRHSAIAQDTGRPMRTRTLWIFVLFSIPIEIISLYLALLSTGAGHGNYLWAWVLFPLPMYLTTFAGSITPLLIVLAVLQFPIYGLIAGFASTKGKLIHALVGMLAFHALALAVPYAMSFYVPRSDRLLDAAREGDAATVVKMLDKGADPNVELNGRGVSAIQLASMGGHLSTVKLLVERGADINHRDPLDGDTALFDALIFDHYEIIEYLLSKGADATIKNSEGRTASELAKAFQDPKSNPTHGPAMMASYARFQALLEAAERGEKPKEPK